MEEDSEVALGKVATDTAAGRTRGEEDTISDADSELEVTERTAIDCDSRPEEIEEEGSEEENKEEPNDELRKEAEETNGKE